MSGDRALIEALTSAVVLGPTDKLVLVMKDLTRHEYDQIRASLDATRFADRVLVVGGPAELAVLRGES